MPLAQSHYLRVHFPGVLVSEWILSDGLFIGH
jgi:hypothetical protein